MLEKRSKSLSQLTFTNRLEQQLLTSLAVLATIPAALLLAVAGKWRITRQQDVSDDSH